MHISARQNKKGCKYAIKKVPLQNEKTEAGPRNMINPESATEETRNPKPSKGLGPFFNNFLHLHQNTFTEALRVLRSPREKSLRGMEIPKAFRMRERSSESALSMR